MANRKTKRTMSKAEVDASAMREIISGLTPVVNEIQDRPRNQCRACDNVRGNKLVEGEYALYTCGACGALFGDCGYLGDSYKYVSAFFSKAEVPAEQQRYFDLSCLSSNGPTRRHGWYDPSTKLITQVG